ncbi:MAG: ABC transporter permease [Anaerolineales bacterium]|nr:ABC transporter permease [Anaerolineales bacterium]
MSALRQLTFVNFKLYIREPIATFFTMAFPPLLVVLFGAMYGNDPNPLFGGYGSMDISMPGYAAMILGTVGLLGVPITISGYRETGVLRRYKAFAMRPLTYIVADVISNLTMTMVGMVCLVLVGWLLYRVRFDGNAGSIILAVILSGLMMFAFGYIIASLAPNARAAQVLGMVIFYPMMFLSGAGIPLEVLPESIQRIADFLPLTYVVRLLRGLWFGDGWGDHILEVGIIGALLVVSTFLAARLFRWE